MPVTTDQRRQEPRTRRSSWSAAQTVHVEFVVQTRSHDHLREVIEALAKRDVKRRVTSTQGQIDEVYNHDLDSLNPRAIKDPNLRRMRQEAFQRLLAREAGGGVDAPAIAMAARRLCERFAQQLTPVIGDAGVAAICLRSLYLAQRRFPSLAVVPRHDDGPFARVKEALQELEPGVAADAAIALLTTASGLLDSLIGQGLTTRLLRRAWPNDFNGDTQEIQ